MNPGTGSVLRELTVVCKEARVVAEKEPKHVAYHYERSERSVMNFESRTHFPPAAKLDDMVAAYATETGVPALELWLRAIRRAAGAAADDHRLAAADGYPGEAELTPQEALEAVDRAEQAARAAASPPRGRAAGR